MSNVHKPQAKTPMRYSAGGETHTMREWAVLQGVPVGTLRKRVHDRVQRGMSIEDAILTPPMPKEEINKLARAATPWDEFKYGKRSRT